MKSTITLVLSLLVTIGGISQTFITQVKPYGEKEWGYMNQNEEFIVDPIYRKCYKFSEEGLAPIYEAKQYSFIDTRGESITTEISGFRLIETIGFGLQGYYDGMVPVRVDDKWGFLDTKGKMAIKLMYNKVTIFDNGFAVAKSGNNFLVINKKGEEVSVEDPKVYVVKHFSEGLAPFNDKEKKNGFINTDGKVIIPAQFMSVGYFVDGLAWAKTMDKKIGFINKKGEWVIEPRFDAAKRFDPVSGLARIKLNDKWSYTDKSGELIYMEDSESWGDFSDGLAKGKKDGKVGYFNSKSEWVIPPEFEGGRNFKNGFVAVKKGGKWGFINQSGEWVIEPKYGGVKDMERVN